jgi:lipopolysaccharide export system permease protein
MRILQRYIWRELLLSFLAVTGALLAILLVYESGAVLARAAEQQYPAGVVLRLFVFGFMQNVSLLLPFGCLLAVVLTFGRLYQDNEMVAAQACGLGRPRLLATVIGLALPVAVLSTWLALQLAPAAAQRESSLRAEALRAALSVPIAAGQFRSLSGGRVVVYARGSSADGNLQDVFIRRGFTDHVEVIVARSARTALAADGMSQTIDLRDGERIEGVPGSAIQRIMRFEQQSSPVVLPVATGGNARISELPLRQLLAQDDGPAQAELQLRISWPIMTLVLAGCAFSLGRLRPRQGRFSRVWVALVWFAFYVAVMQVAVTWVERGVTGAVPGAWWVHVVFAALAVWLARGSRKAPKLRNAVAAGTA